MQEIIVEHREEKKFSFLIKKTVSMTTLVRLWYLGGEEIFISITKKLKLETYEWWMLHFVHQDILDQDSGKNLFLVKFVKLEGAIYVESNTYSWTSSKIRIPFYSSPRKISVVYHSQLHLKTIKNLSQNIGFISMVIDTFISGIRPNKERSHLNICDNSMIHFGENICLGFSSTSHFYRLDIFRKWFIEHFN